MEYFTKITILITILIMITGCSFGGLLTMDKQEPEPLKMNISNLHLFRGISSVENELNSSTISFTQKCPMCKESKFGYTFNIVKNTSYLNVNPTCKTDNQILLPDIKGNKTFIPNIYGNLTDRKSASVFYLSDDENRVKIVINSPTKPSVQESKKEGFPIYKNPGLNEYKVSFDFSEINLTKELVCSLELTDDLQNTTKKYFIVK